MKHCKRALSILLALCLLLSAVSGALAAPLSESAQSSDPEIQKAIELGFVTRDYAAEPDRQATYAEFATMLDALVKTVMPDRQADWTNISKTFRDAKEPMCRGAGAVALFDCTMALGIDTEGYDTGAGWLEGEMPKGMDFWEGMPWDDPHLPNAKDAYVTDAYEGTAWASMTEYPILQNAGWFVQRFSYGNGKCYLDYDKNSSFRWGDGLTRADAIRAVERLYETARYVVFAAQDSVPLGVTEETLRLARSMPSAAWNDLPDWTGYTITSPIYGCDNGECGRYFYEEEIKRIADTGFNFVRVPLDFSFVFGGNGSTEQVRVHFVKSMDELLNWCAKYGIHVCFDIHDAPGFNTGGSDADITIFENASQQKLFCAFWAWMAERYQSVPSNLLSFNLMNEPHKEGELSDAAYSALMLKAIDAIREHSPDRLIFADMLGVRRGRPVEGLATARVAQATHAYYMREGAKQWPSNTINGFIARDIGTLTIDGSFPAGTTITTQIELAHGVGTLTWNAGSTKTEAFSVGGEGVNEGGCIEIQRDGAGGEWRRYKSKGWSVTLTKDCDQLTLRQDGSGNWYKILSITVKTPAKTFCIACHESFVPDNGVPRLTFLPDGTIQAADPDTFLSMGKDDVEAIFQEYADFTVRTGEAVMIQEFGSDPAIPDQAARSFADDLLSLAEQYGIPWCSWNEAIGLWLSDAEVECHTKRNLPGPFFRADANYKDLGNGWRQDMGMTEVFQKHMSASKPVSPSFTDVPAGEWYADAVSWAVSKNITSGTGGGKFSPGQNCTHSQILTFLYRANRNQGKAEAADMDNAVAWAKEEGMIGDNFNGSKECTRAEAVNYIWQALGKQDAAPSSFIDVSANADYAAAVSWAVENGVIRGTNAAQTTFSPNEICNRGHIVTFLYRAMA